MAEATNLISIFAPMTGSVMELDTVPDPDFAEKRVGDGVAIIPEDNIIYSPVNGQLNRIDKSKCAFHFMTDDDIHLLVQVGIGTEAMENSPITQCLEEGVRVQAGDQIASVDLEGLMKANVLPMTPIVICGGLENLIIKPGTGRVEAGAGAVFTVEDKRVKSDSSNHAVDETESADTEEENDKEAPAEKKKSSSMGFGDLDRSMLIKLGVGFVIFVVVMVIIFVMISSFIFT